MTAHDDPAGPEPDVSAAELALGLLDGEERAAALRRVMADPAFAAEVETWRDRFAELFDQWPEASPPADSEARLAAAVPHSPAGASRPAEMRSGKRGLLIGWATASSLVAAVLALVLLTRSPERVTVSPPPAPTLVAAIMPQSGSSPAPLLYDAEHGRVSVPAASPASAGQSAQMWVIGSDGVPHSLGLMADAQKTVLTLTPEQRARMVAGVTIAVSIEPAGGSPTGLPTGPVVAKGILSAA